jgi:hypothetical protein
MTGATPVRLVPVRLVRGEELPRPKPTSTSAKNSPLKNPRQSYLSLEGDFAYFAHPLAQIRIFPRRKTAP